MEPAPERVVTTLRRQVVMQQTRFDDAWVAAQGWAVVPVGEIAHYAGSSVCQAFTRGLSELVACTCEPLADWAVGSWSRGAVVLAADEYDAWRAEHLMFDVVVAAPDLSSALLDTTEGHLLVGGARSRIADIFGGDVAGAFDSFDAYAADMAGGSRHLPQLGVQLRSAYDAGAPEAQRRTDLEEALLDLGMEDLIALPETLHASETAALLQRAGHADDVARALVSLLASDRIQVWSGRWDGEPEVVDRATAATLLQDVTRYELGSAADDGRRVYYVNVDNLRA